MFARSLPSKLFPSGLVQWDAASYAPACNQQVCEVPSLKACTWAEYVVLALLQLGHQIISVIPSLHCRGPESCIQAHQQLRRDALALQDGIADEAAARQDHQVLQMLLQQLQLQMREAIMSMLPKHPVDLNQCSGCTQLQIVIPPLRMAIGRCYF